MSLLQPPVEQPPLEQPPTLLSDLVEQPPDPQLVQAIVNGVYVYRELRQAGFYQYPLRQNQLLGGLPYAYRVYLCPLHGLLPGMYQPFNGLTLHSVAGKLQNIRPQTYGLSG